MKLHHLRNATGVIESGPHHILIDPMLCDKGELPPFTYLRHPPIRNPMVPLPDNAPAILDKVTLCLITHSQKWGIEPLTHSDHLDHAGRRFLRERHIPVVCRQKDGAYMRKHGILIEAELNHWESTPLCNGQMQVTAFPAQHGHGWIHRLLANGAGFHLNLAGEPSLLISGDTILTHSLRRAMRELKPDLAVVAAGCARLDLGGLILMPLSEIIHFIELAPGKVIANHLEALNHCPTTRMALKRELEKKDLSAKTLIPEDGETLVLDPPCT